MPANEKDQPKRQGKTPYQGKKRCFGHYKCPQCNKNWMSAYSWANMGQECMECRINVFPFLQRPLKKRSRPAVFDKDKSHKKELCDKCKQLGHSCVRIRSP
ncbi:unnamed protein product [Psylliodes chrysocephalus]|uniref:3CxxC-type domain-containing protein n=1 Tax=Psylliodes chrysocephalus TaxID=3402493 RepID=A0A9P0GI43_9CUCU|nr:unnamed protein product [Psylliodes chrysocephala]